MPTLDYGFSAFLRLLAIDLGNPIVVIFKSSLVAICQ